MKVVNMTPHQVNIVDADSNIVRVYEVSGLPLIRLASKTVEVGILEDGTPLSKTVFGKPEGLPDFVEGVFYLVSQIVKNALPDRSDLLVPAEVVRDTNGTIVGCRSLGV